MKKVFQLIFSGFLFVSIMLIACACAKDYDITVQFFAGDKLVATKYLHYGDKLGSLPSYTEDGFNLLSWHYTDGGIVSQEDKVLSNSLVSAKLSYNYIKSEDRNISENEKVNIKKASRLIFSTNEGLFVSSDDLKDINELAVKELDLSPSSFLNNEIPDNAFLENNNLEYIILPNNLQIISNCAFKNCSSLKNVFFAEGVEEIRSEAFYNTKLESIILPDSLKTIGNNAFSSCKYLLSVECGKNLVNVSYNFVDDSINLERIDIREAGTYFSDNGSIYVTETAVDDFGNDVISYKLLRCPEGKTGTFTMFNKTSVIGKYSLYNCKKLNQIILASNELSRGAEIEEYALCGCDNVKNIKLSTALKTIGDYAFYGCTGVNYFNLEETMVKSIGANAFRECNRLTSVILPSSIENIGEYAFYNLTDLTIVDALHNLNNVSFGDYAFSKTHYYQKLRIRISEINNVLSVGKESFGKAYVSSFESNPNMVDVYVNNKAEFDSLFADNYTNLSYITK